MGMRRSEAPRLDGSIADIARNGEGRALESAAQLVYAVVTNATAISGRYERWVYQCSEAWVGPAPTYDTAARPDGRTYPTCLSVSENGNGVLPTRISYGVNTSNLLGSFGAVRIPNGTPVVMTPHRNSDGTLIWLIVNTQAIDGTCSGAGGGGGGGGG